MFDMGPGLGGSYIELFLDYMMKLSTYLRHSEKTVLMAYIYVERYVNIKN